MSNRYDTSGHQGAVEPGSNGQVLANKLHITDPAEMDQAELVLLEKLYEAALAESLPPRRVTVQELVSWHRRWLGPIYDWAGELRSVNASKGGFMFAAAGQIQRLLSEFERDCLDRYTPTSGEDTASLAQAIAVSHAELVLIHPFVEGNGRLSRLLADVMAVQGGREPLDYTAWDADRSRYFAAVQTAVGRDYAALRELVLLALR